MSKNGLADLLSWLADQQGAMLELLAAIVNIDSGTSHKPGIDRVAERIAAFLSSHGIHVETIAQQKYGNCLRAYVPARGEGDGGNILLMGHQDTVFPVGEAARRPFSIRDGVARGPGVSDMKAGLVMNSFLLAGFAKFGGAPSSLVGLYTGDEEITSPEGRPVIEAEALRARVVLNSEPGKVSGDVVTGRKGGVFLTLEVTGKAAHAGANFFEGVSAIHDLAHKLIRIAALTDQDAGVTLNVGLITGGQTVNTVAPGATARIDLRYIRSEQRKQLLDALARIAAEVDVEGASASLTIDGEFLPLVQSEASARLFELYAEAAAEVGFTAGSRFMGGCADSGFAAAQGVPTLCGVGPSGANAHSPEEYTLVDSLVPRAQACARVIAGLDRHGL